MICDEPDDSEIRQTFNLAGPCASHTSLDTSWRNRSSEIEQCLPCCDAVVLPRRIQRRSADRCVKHLWVSENSEKTLLSI